MTTIDIDALLQPLGPFERPPVIAAAVSGGSDSTALGLLLASWIAARGGQLHVLSVDHGLRPEARAECAAVARRFSALPGCSAEILTWDGAKPATGLQQAARHARYRLMTDWCRARGILHLALGHTRDDQAETVAMRRGHGSSPLGLAGMPAIAQRNGVRLLRPLLGVTRADLRAGLTARGEGWIEDPSNAATQFERVRQRAALAESGDGDALADAAGRDGMARDIAERDVARFLARAAKLAPEGWLGIDQAAWRATAPELRGLVLRQALLAVGGHAYPPAPAAVQVLADSDPSEIAGTLTGCILAARQGQLIICREAGDVRDFPEVTPGWCGRWDQRFELAVAADLRAGDLAIRPLGAEGQRQAALQHGLSLKRHPVPAAARAALPALWHGEQVLAQPHLALGHGLTARLAPRHNATTCGFTVALRPPHTMYSSFPG